MTSRYMFLMEQINIALNQEMSATNTPTNLHAAICHSLLASAKRVRGALLLLALESYGYMWQRGLYPAMALEYIHCYSLIHDDLPCMDDDYLRRGRPSNHLLFGEATAVLAGDALQSGAFALLYRGYSAGAYNARILAELLLQLAQASGSSGMVGGQAAEFALGTLSAKNSISETRKQRLWEQVREVHLLKTGALLGVPFLMATLLAELGDEEATALMRLATQFGLVFQIQDDLLDYLGDPKMMGKAVGRDRRMRKVTYPAILGLKKATKVLDEEYEVLIGLLDKLHTKQSFLYDYILAMRHRER